MVRRLPIKAIRLDRKTIVAEVLSGTLADMEAEWRSGLETLKSELRAEASPAKWE